MTIQAAIFDLDGTLVDTLQDIVTCTNACLNLLDSPAQTRDLIRKSVGDGIETLCRRVLPGADESKVRKLVSTMRDYYSDQLEESAAPYDGILDMLSSLQSMGFRLAVLSNKPDRMTQSIVGRMFGSIDFNAILGHKDGIPLKPDPGGALGIAQTMGLLPSEIIYVGDTEVDINTGTAAGMRTFGVTWGFRTPEELAECGAERLVDRPGEIVDWVSSCA